jgi:hypothetical protein
MKSRKPHLVPVKSFDEIVHYYKEEEIDEVDIRTPETRILCSPKLVFDLARRTKGCVQYGGSRSDVDNVLTDLDGNKAVVNYL